MINEIIKCDKKAEFYLPPVIMVINLIPLFTENYFKNLRNRILLSTT